MLIIFISVSFKYIYLALIILMADLLVLAILVQLIISNFHSNFNIIKKEKRLGLVLVVTPLVKTSLLMSTCF